MHPPEGRGVFDIRRSYTLLFLWDIFLLNEHPISQTLTDTNAWTEGAWPRYTKH